MSKTTPSNYLFVEAATRKCIQTFPEETTLPGEKSRERGENETGKEGKKFLFEQSCFQLSSEGGENKLRLIL